ncbi:VOC family protein [Neisseriaceae bacterium JH1-16]|nr:VOC family protein [Neisseriaceae bacterium JH1-16]
MIQPEGHQLFLDHVGYFVPDLDIAASQLEKLGFRVSKTNTQKSPNEQGELIPTGTSNRLVMLKQGFLETLAATSPTPLADQLTHALSRYQGLHLIALAHADLPGQRERLIQQNFAMQQCITLRRWVPTPDGERQTGISVLRTQPGEMAEGRVQMVTNHTPELFWTPGSTDHENCAEAITDLLICVPDPGEAASRYERYTGKTARSTDGLVAFPMDHGRLVLMTPDKATSMLPGFAMPSLPYMAGIAIRSNNIDVTRSVLERNGVPLLFTSKTLLYVGPGNGLGSYMLFHTDSIEEPWSALAHESGVAAKRSTGCD